jgi:hypothetical protein
VLLKSVCCVRVPFHEQNRAYDRRKRLDHLASKLGRAQMAFRSYRRLPLSIGTSLARVVLRNEQDSCLRHGRTCPFIVPTAVDYNSVNSLSERAQLRKGKWPWPQEPGHAEVGAALRWLPELRDEVQGRPSAQKMYFDTTRRPFADHVGPVELFLTPGGWLKPRTRCRVCSGPRRGMRDRLDAKVSPCTLPAMSRCQGRVVEWIHLHRSRRCMQ